MDDMNTYSLRNGEQICCPSRGDKVSDTDLTVNLPAVKNLQSHKPQVNGDRAEMGTWAMRGVRWNSHDHRRVYPHGHE